MQKIQRLLLAGTVWSCFAWLPAGAAVWTDESAANVKAAGTFGTGKIMITMGRHRLLSRPVKRVVLSVSNLL